MEFIEDIIYKIFKLIYDILNEFGVDTSKIEDFIKEEDAE